MDRLRAEEVVDGRYRVMSRIGSGGMADVYCAEDLQLGRNVALKVLHERFAADREFVERFRREASSAAGLQHPNVVGVYDRGEVDGTSYIAMEHVEGRTLKQLVLEEAPLEPGRAIDLVLQVLRAARFAHRRGIVHRDLKPHNVIVDDSARPPVAKVTDFGIARAGASDMTETGSIMGTAQYLSPEQAQGHAVSARSDLYSVGIILYELLAGRVPFDGDSAVTVALKQVQDHAVPPSHFNAAVTPELDEVVRQAMAKDPADRPADADAFIAMLEDAGARLGTVAVAHPGYAAYAAAPAPATGEWPAVAPLEPLPPRERGDGRWWWIGLGLLAAAVAIAALLLLGGADEVAVPNVVGAEQSTAEQRLKREGFLTEITTKTSEREEGTVIGTDPPPGTQAEQGSTVRLTVSGGPGTVSVPAVTGRPRSEALRLLAAAGLKVSEEKQPSADVPTNRVVSVVPGQGSEVQRGSEVALVVSSGRARAAVPDVTGQTRAEAESALRAAGFEVRIDEQQSETKAGTVTGQDPAAGTRAAEGSAVTITVATQPEQVAVPDITGEEAAAAVATLSGAGFKVDQTERMITTPDGDGTVVEQDPAGGGKADRGATIRIVIARFDPALDPEGTGTDTTGGATPDGTTTPADPGTTGDADPGAAADPTAAGAG